MSDSVAVRGGESVNCDIRPQLIRGWGIVWHHAHKARVELPGAVNHLSADEHIYFRWLVAFVVSTALTPIRA
jgi:hypothetical protein